jgi:hypothetical protein
MKQLTLFRLFTYILLPFASFFAVMDLIMLLSAIGNPSLLLGVFLLAAFCIYVFASMIFLIRHIDRNQHAKSSLKDWIKVNAYASLFLGFQFLITAVGIFYMGEQDLKNVVDKFLESQPNMPSNLNIALFVKVMRGAAYFLFFFAFVLLVHITMGLRLLKQYAFLFADEVVDQD